MPVIDSQTLFNETKCYLCYGPISESQMLALGLERRWLLNLDSTADVSPQSLLAYAKCYACYAGNTYDLLELALLDQISQLAGTASGCGSPTNTLSISGAGTSDANGVYNKLNDTEWDHISGNYFILFLEGIWQLLDIFSVVQYTASDLCGPWTVQLGAGPAPTSQYL